MFYQLNPSEIINLNQVVDIGMETRTEPHSGRADFVVNVLLAEGRRYQLLNEEASTFLEQLPYCRRVIT